MSPVKKAVKTSLFSLFGNIVLVLIKAISGVFGHSFALIADAIESTSDIFSSILVLIGIKYSNKPADKNHPYGHGRAEPLFTFLLVIFLIVSAAIIAYNAIENIRTPHQSPQSWTLMVLGVIILWKEISFQYVNKKSKELNSTSLKADAWHHRSDALTSITAFIGISIAVFFGKGYENADDYAALFAAGLILYNSYLIFRPALGELMDEDIHKEMTAEIKTVSLTVNGILDIEKCLIRKTGMKYQVDLHAIVDANITVKEGHDLAHQLKDELKRKIPTISDVLIHIEPHI